MGMAASQARLLSITARLSNNEMEQQSVAYSKQRLADNSEQANNAYLEALNKTKFQVLVGYNDSQANYVDLTYASITGNNSVACGKQYIVKTNKGQILVSQQVADAFSKFNGDYNKFLSTLGYTQTDIDMSNSEVALSQIHEAWDRYLVSVKKGCYDENGNSYYTENGGYDDNYIGQHILNFGFTSFNDGPFDGYATYNTASAVSPSGHSISLGKDANGYYTDRNLIVTQENADGETVAGYKTLDENGNQVFNKLENVRYDKENETFIYTDENGEEAESKVLYYDVNDETVNTDAKNYFTQLGDGRIVSVAQKAYSLHCDNHALNFEGTTKEQRELYDYALSLTATYYDAQTSGAGLKYDAQTLAYYKNIFNEMRTCGYTTLEESFGQKLQTTTSSDGVTGETKIFNDPNWLVTQLKAGNLTLAYYSVAEKGFVSTTMDDDESITEREDSSAIKIAEQVYKNHMDKIEHQDKQFDMELTKLESEHNALQTEYDSVKKVISNNVEKSFNTFNA